MNRVFAMPDCTPEEREIYAKIAAKLGVRLTAKVSEKIKYIREDQHCTLCNATTSYYMKLNRFIEGKEVYWKFIKLVSSEEAGEIKKLDIRKLQVSTCHSCARFLAGKSKLELIKLVLQLKSAVLIHLSTREALKALVKKGPDNEQS
jgi:hypothetical protein